MINLLDLGIAFLQSFLMGLKNKVPAEVVAALQSALDAIAKHKDDIINKTNLEAQRG